MGAIRAGKGNTVARTAEGEGDQVGAGKRVKTVSAGREAAMEWLHELENAGETIREMSDLAGSPVVL